jgi:ferredoxin
VKVSVDLAKCVGHGRCYVLGPDVFSEDERGRCVLLLDSVPAELAHQARLGEENCPEQAISVEDD